MNGRIYFASCFDNQWHNINDWEHILSDNGKEASIGQLEGDEFRIDEEVTLYTLEEVFELLNGET